MKKLILYISWVLTAGLTLLMDCTKVDNTKVINTPPPGGDSSVKDSITKMGRPAPKKVTPVANMIPKNLFARVIEYSTLSPVPSALLTMNYCTVVSGQCTTSRIAGSWLTDTQGTIFVNDLDSVAPAKTGESGSFEFSKDNYWSEFIGYNGLTGKYLTDTITQILYPFAWIKIHLKNEIYHLDTINIYLHFDPDDLQFEFNHFDYFGKHRLFVFQPNNLDTTIIIKTYAYGRNDLFIEQDSVDFLNHYRYGLYSGYPSANKFDTTDVEIIIKN